jgi:hypothetical protein
MAFSLFLLLMCLVPVLMAQNFPITSRDRNLGITSDNTDVPGCTDLANQKLMNECLAQTGGGGGSGDITQVGDCTTGACFTAAGDATTLTSRSDFIVDIDADGNDPSDAFLVRSDGSQILHVRKGISTVSTGVLDLINAAGSGDARLRMYDDGGPDSDSDMVLIVQDDASDNSQLFLQMEEGSAKYTALEIDYHHGGAEAFVLWGNNQNLDRFTIDLPTTAGDFECLSTGCTIDSAAILTAGSVTLPVLGSAGVTDIRDDATAGIYLDTDSGSDVDDGERRLERWPVIYADDYCSDPVVCSQTEIEALITAAIAADGARVSLGPRRVELSDRIQLAPITGGSDRAVWLQGAGAGKFIKTTTNLIDNGETSSCATELVVTNAAMCEAAGDPWACCTGVGAGTGCFDSDARGVIEVNEIQWLKISDMCIDLNQDTNVSEAIYVGGRRYADATIAGGIGTCGVAQRGDVRAVTDAVDGTDCTTGSSSTNNYCKCTGSAWVDANTQPIHFVEFTDLTIGDFEQDTADTVAVNIDSTYVSPEHFTIERINVPHDEDDYEGPFTGIQFKRADNLNLLRNLIVASGWDDSDNAPCSSVPCRSRAVWGQWGQVNIFSGFYSVSGSRGDAGPEAVNGFDFNVATGSEDELVRNDGGSWITDGFATGDGIVIVNATASANDGNYNVIGVPSASTLRVANGAFTTYTTNDTSVIIYEDNDSVGIDLQIAHDDSLADAACTSGLGCSNLDNEVEHFTVNGVLLEMGASGGLRGTGIRVCATDELGDGVCDDDRDLFITGTIEGSSVNTNSNDDYVHVATRGAITLEGNLFGKRGSATGEAGRVFLNGASPAGGFDGYLYADVAGGWGDQSPVQLVVGKNVKFGGPAPGTGVSMASELWMYGDTDDQDDLADCTIEVDDAATDKGRMQLRCESGTESLATLLDLDAINGRIYLGDANSTTSMLARTSIFDLANESGSGNIQLRLWADDGPDATSDVVMIIADDAGNDSRFTLQMEENSTKYNALDIDYHTVGAESYVKFGDGGSHLDRFEVDLNATGGDLECTSTGCTIDSSAIAIVEADPQDAHTSFDNVVAREVELATGQSVTSDNYTPTNEGDTGTSLREALNGIDDQLAVRSAVFEWSGFAWDESNDDGDCMVSTMRFFDNASTAADGWAYATDGWDVCTGNDGRWDRQHTLPVYQATTLAEFQCVAYGITGLTSTDTIEIQPVFNSGGTDATQSITFTSADGGSAVHSVDMAQTPTYIDVRLRVDKVGSVGTVTNFDVICTMVIEF